MDGRTLLELGLATVPFEHPLTYPGQPVPWPALLRGDRLLRLASGAGSLGGMYVEGGPRLDQVLDDLDRRHPVLAVGSNACPAQVAYKLARRSLSTDVPMVPVRVRGIGIGCSAHVGRAGYVAAAPYPDPDSTLTLVLSWLDDAQLAAVDATELPNYRRRWLDESHVDAGGPGAWIYTGERGVLAGPDGRPLAGGEQGALLTGLLAGSAALRALLGPDARSWVRAARADAAVRDEAARLFAAESRVLHPTWPEPSRRGYPPNPYGGVSTAPTS
ncbi:hypothetical protein [Streptomyces luteolus]|uniref:Uncharacterized protein n=1 Tax=Streptomyces luteolus TaxID=3043615 RepID=A0ABT6SRD9_9ACTN|nr:hypothetical protein [Streptomyces sp. B-S-A12]MDI3417207.1 hypothetical protein [Streptomyces sp. B-S-A12]